jgi:hypothetical protein
MHIVPAKHVVAAQVETDCSTPPFSPCCVTLGEEEVEATHCALPPDRSTHVVPAMHRTWAHVTSALAANGKRLPSRQTPMKANLGITILPGAPTLHA